MGAHRQAAPDVERADPFRRVHLVSGHRQSVTAERLDGEVELPDGLDGVAVEVDASLPAEAGHLSGRLQDSGLVVGQHHRDEARVRAEGVDHARRIDETAP